MCTERPPPPYLIELEGVKIISPLSPPGWTNLISHLEQKTPNKVIRPFSFKYPAGYSDLAKYSVFSKVGYFAGYPVGGVVRVMGIVGR